MKKTQLLITALCASALLLGACNSKPNKKKTTSSVTSSQPEKVLSSIAVTTNPTKTSYAVGESFDPSGMVVTATYSDGSTSDVTGQCTFSPSVMAESTTSVTVSYEGKTTTVAVNKVDWSAADVQVLETAAHGAKIPFPNEGTYTFALDSYGSAGDYYGGESSAEKIAAYKARFDTTVWEVTDFRSGVGFFAEVPVQTDDGKRYVQVICAGYDSTEKTITEDGSGQFFLEVSDPYYYSWADQDVGEELNYYFSYFASIGHASNYELELPTFTEEIDHMSVMISDLAQYEYYASMYFAYGMRYSPSPYAFQDEIDIYCSSTAAEAYLNALNDANSDFEYLGYDQDKGAYYFASKEGSLGLQVGYMVSYGVFYIVPFQNYTTAFPSEYLKGVLDRYQPSAPAFPAFAPSEDTVYYFEDFDNCYFVTCFQDGNMSEEALTTYIAGLDTAVFNVGEKQTEEGVSYYQVSAIDGSYTFYASFYEETAEEYAYVEFQVYASLPTYNSLPVSYIDAYWAAENLVVPAAHEFAVASAEAYFELLEYKQGGFDIYVYGATSAELATFVAGFSTESWTVDADTESGSYQLICGDMSVAGNLVAVIEISDNSTDTEDPYIGLSYYVGVVPEQQAA